MTTSKSLKECLCCGSENVKTILDLDKQPLANSFKTAPEDHEETYPLALNLCTDCTHLQLSYAVDPDLLFKNYLYVSGTTQTLKDYFQWFVDYSLEYFDSKPTSILDIACNDGTQLDVFKSAGLKTYGIDPATNLYDISSKNHEIICDYFTSKYTYHYKNKNLDMILAQNVLAHNSYPLEFLQQCRDIMNDKTLLFVQTSQADMIKNNEFDTVYHEHISFFNVHSMKALADRAGLYLIDVEKTPIHGNSLVFVFSKLPQTSAKVDFALQEEVDNGMQDLNTYLTYAENCKNITEDLKKTIIDYRGQGYVVAGYGAAAKGMTVLNFGDLQLDFIIDDNPLKQGKFTPGTNIPVVSVDIMKEVEDINVAWVPLAWNFFTEIRSRIKSVRDKDEDKFILYFPKIKVE